jgi:hypothetical protein
VVGDPESCIMEGAGYELGAHGVTVAPALLRSGTRRGAGLEITCAFC